MSVNLFETNADRQSETLTTIAFIMSIAGFFLSLFTDYIFGFIIYFLIYTFAARGLKTKKSGLALTAMLITSVSILIFILKILTNLD